MAIDQFDEKVLQPRAITSSTWSAILSLLWLLASLQLIFWHQDPFHPLDAIQELLGTIASPGSWPIFLFYGGLVSWWTLCHTSTFVTKPSVFKSWSSLCHQVLFDPNTLSSVMANSLISVAITMCILKLGPPKYSSVLADCGPDTKAHFCFNEKHIFLLAVGLFTGIIISIQYNFFSDNAITFPIIYKEKWSQIKQRLRPMPLNCLKKSTKVAKAFYILFVFLVVSTNSVYNLLEYVDLSLLFMVITISSLLLVINATRLLVFNILACEPLNLSLEDHLTAIQSPQLLLQLLSLQNLARLSAQSPQIRQEIFSLSQPGGHPHNWNTIYKACIAMINDISDSVAEINAPKLAPTTAPSAVMTPQPIMSPMRRLAPTLPPKVEELTVSKNKPTVASQLQLVFCDIFKTFKSKPILSIFFHKTVDYEVRSVLCRSQSVRWAIDILSNLVASSVAEDKFGVVQKDLPAILASLFTLEKTLNKIRGPFQGDHRDLTLKQELKQNLKSGLYRIVIKFGEHILEIPLSKEFAFKMENYQRFLEA